MNLWVGIGRATGDPRISFYGDNKKMARYTLAVDRGIKRDPDNPEQQTADFISCVAYGYSADFADNYIRKGTKIAVTGRIQTGKYTNKDGQTVYTTDILVDRQEFCEPKNNNQNAQPAQASQNEAPKPATETDNTFVNIPENMDLELPFS